MFVNTFHANQLSHSQHPSSLQEPNLNESCNQNLADPYITPSVPFPKLISLKSKYKYNKLPLPALKPFPSFLDLISTAPPSISTNSTSTKQISIQTKAGKNQNLEELRSPLCIPTRIISSPSAKNAAFQLNSNDKEFSKKFDERERNDFIGKRRNALGNTEHLIRLFGPTKQIRKPSIPKRFSPSQRNSFSLSAAPILRLPHRRHSLSISLVTVKRKKSEAVKISLPSISQLHQSLEGDYAKSLRAQYENNLKNRRMERLF